MSNERDAPEGTSEPAASRPRLKPPPPRLTPASEARSAVVPPARPAPARLTPARSATATWITLAFFGVLILGAITVFVVLPPWVRDRQQASQAELAAGVTPGDGGPPAAEPADRDPELEAPGSEPEVGTEAPPAPTAELQQRLEPPAAEPRIAELRPAPPAEPRAAPPPRSTASQPARAGSGSPAGGEFARAMSAGLAALDREDFAAAREAFSRAAALRPGSPQSADGLARAESGARLAALSALRQEALAFESREDWRAAEERYKAALELDPTVEFALAGLARSNRRAELAERLAFHLQNPGRLSSDEVLEEASTVLEQAFEIEGSPRLAQQRQQLAQAVAAFSTPVTATLESDQLTEVVVYRVGRLGSFSRRALELRPGTYTVVGSRQGFRDVRRQLVIEPGVEPGPLAIRCEEEI